MNNVISNEYSKCRSAEHSSINNFCRDDNNNTRTYDSLDTRFAISESSITQTNSHNLSDDFSINIYRYKFTNDFTNELYNFSKIHQFDHRIAFKEAWNIWIEENEELVENEVRRLNNLGYDGDILDKMFKSARYYFRKKSTEKKAPQERRNYIGSQKEFLESIDDHIKSNIVLDSSFKPSDGFELFCKERVDTLKEEVSRLCKSGLSEPLEIKNKIKKTYKNRYFLIINTINNKNNINKEN